jgi:hypothetical protein
MSKVRTDGRFNRRGVDCMGYKLAPVLGLFSEQEIAAARRLSKAAEYLWDTVGTDPLVTGWRFLRSAAICLRGWSPEKPKGV